MNENYEYNHVLTKLTYLTKRNNLSQKELGDAINVERRAMNGRAERNSKFKPAEIKQIEAHFGVDLSSVSICVNSLERQNDKTVEERFSHLGWRLCEIEEKHEYLEKDMARLLDITETDYIYIKSGDLEPDIAFLNKLKQRFEVSIDWLLYGD